MQAVDELDGDGIAGPMYLTVHHHTLVLQLAATESRRLIEARIVPMV